MPETEFHCTMRYDPTRDPELEKQWLEQTKELEIPLNSEYLVVGPKGAALQIEENRFIQKWFRIDNSTPHVTLYISEGCRPEDLGPMMLHAKGKAWEATENPFIFQTTDMMYLKILCQTKMKGIPKMIVETREMKKELNSKLDELMMEMEQRVPQKLWSKHDTDVGLVKSANPVRIKTKPGVQLPRKQQYPLKPEAVEGIRKTIEGLIKAGVLIETVSYCNTPILPVEKANKSKWRLVHDLRAVNEVVEDWPAEVPNPHTLLTNVPPAANYFTVIDLCSAFFSVPLAEESRHLFSFTYQAPDGSFTKAMKKLKSLRTEVTENAGRDRKIGEWFDSLFGSWKEWLVKVGVIIAVALGIFVLLFCCVLPFLRSTMAGAAAKQMVNVSVKQSGVDIGCTTTTGVYPIGPGLDELDEFP
ncbi:uncharacterized protein LOC125251062 [Megalobrama amblycephala]|uniref:uncharacterized protein LOC125251062 n=1 Tax=Megalobrama amblycephala TaxID=75352 RepID=UPI0020141908|nr:uncharacterized protein LOC125251062 [Megalobrama amblycephala]